MTLWSQCSPSFAVVHGMIQGTLVGLSTGEWRTLHKCSTQFGERWVFSAAYIGRIRGLRLGKLGASADFGHPAIRMPAIRDSEKLENHYAVTFYASCGRMLRRIDGILSGKGPLATRHLSCCGFCGTLCGSTALLILENSSTIPR